MSWDAVIIKGPKPSSEEFQMDNFHALSLGSLEDVITHIQATMPRIQRDSQYYGFYQEHGLSIEIDLKTTNENEVTKINISASGNGDPIGILTTLCKKNMWEIFDMQNAEFIDLNHPSSESWLEFTHYRDHVIRTYKKKWWEFWKK